MADRATQTLKASAVPNRNGMRQPQASSAAGFKACTVRAQTPTAKSPPTSLAAAAEEVISPRRWRAAPSSRYATTPVYSPPTEKLITQRSSKSSQPATGPIAE
jgi:hypothetical protein